MMIRICSFRGRGGVSGEKDSWHNVLEIGEENISNTITSVQKDNFVMNVNYDFNMEQKSKLNRYVRYIYRKMMGIYGTQKVREEGLRIFALTTPEKARVKAEQATTFSDGFVDAILSLAEEWQIPTKFINEELSMFGTPEDLEQTLIDLTPIRVRIRKLTPTECLRLMGVDDAAIGRMKDSGLSNSALYKLAGNSIVTNCLEGIFTNMFKAEQDALF